MSKAKPSASASVAQARCRRAAPCASCEKSAGPRAYAHGQGVVHRDVKPDNVLLEAGSGRALVTDFGIAHLATDAGLMEPDVAGTVEFMSPERASGNPVDSRSDLYSLGVIGQHVLAGCLPFQGPVAAATLAKQLTQAPPRTASIAPGVPEPLARAIDRCLAKDPAERFADGEEFAARSRMDCTTVTTCPWRSGCS